MLERLSKNERILFGAAAISIGTLIIFYLILDPLKKKMTGLDSRIVAQEVKIKKFVRLLQNKEQILNEYDRHEKYFKTSGSDEEIQARMLGEIERMAKSCGVYILDMKPQPVKKINNYKKYIVDVQAEGGLEEFITFVYRLYQADLLYDLDRLNTYLKGQKEENIIKYDLVVSQVVFI